MRGKTNEPSVLLCVICHTIAPVDAVTCSQCRHGKLEAMSLLDAEVRMNAFRVLNKQREGAKPEQGLGYEYVKHPTHYNTHPSGIECITIIQHFTLNVGMAVKYLWRCGLKPDNNSIQELEKAKQYIDFEIQRLEKHVKLDP